MSIDWFMGDFHHHQQIPPKQRPWKMGSFGQATDGEAIGQNDHTNEGVKARPTDEFVAIFPPGRQPQTISTWRTIATGSHKLYHNSMEFQQNECIRHFMPDSRQLSSQKNKPQTNTRNWGCNPKKGHIIRKLLVKYLSNPPKKQHQTGQTAWIRVDHKKYEMIFAGNDLHTYEIPGPTSSIWAYAQWLNA